MDPSRGELPIFARKSPIHLRAKLSRFEEALVFDLGMELHAAQQLVAPDHFDINFVAYYRPAMSLISSIRLR